MKSKPSDIPYCNVNKQKITNANPKLNEENVQHFYEWITERYLIHLKKDIEKSPPPWTNNKILLNYRFTNVRREHDKETLWLIKNICLNENINYRNKILNIILFRLFNKSSTIEIIKLQDFNQINLKEIEKKILEFKNKNSGYIWFSNAFYTSGPKTAANRLFCKENIILNIIKLVEHYESLNIIEKIASSKNQKEVYDSLISLPGIGKFLAYQIFVDFTYIPQFPFSENEFVIAGPGCINGLNLIFKDFDSLSYEEALFWLRDNQNKIFSEFNYNPKKLFLDLPEEDRHLNIMSLENCMCEISKYIRAIKGNGRPRIRYKIKT